MVEQSGAVIPGAKITVTNQATHVGQYSLSSDSGSFRILSLPEGLFTIEVEAKGFKLWSQKDVHLEANEVKTIYPTLALPTQTEVVEVSGTIAAVETDKSDTSRELEEGTIATAPLLGRNVYTSMIQLAPGITGSGLPSGGVRQAPARTTTTVLNRNKPTRSTPPVSARTATSTTLMVHR